jgi:hypothetical protein
MYFAQLAMDHAAARHESTSCVRKHNALGCPHKQLGLHFAFELCDALAYRRLRDADASGRRAKAARVNGCQQVSDLIESHWR